MTADPNGWPSRPGVPLNPRRNGWHWLRRAYDGRCICMQWSAKERRWLDGVKLSADTVVEYGAIYLGPALLPTEVAAREAAAFKRGAEAMREEAAQYLLTLSASSPRWGSPEEHAEAIRALPIPEDKP